MQSLLENAKIEQTEEGQGYQPHVFKYWELIGKGW